MIHDVLVHSIAPVCDRSGRRLEVFPPEALSESGDGSLELEILYPGTVRAWYRYDAVEWFCGIGGMIQLVLFDGRRRSPTFGELQEIFTGEYQVQVVKIPSGVYRGWKLLSGAEGRILRLLTRPGAIGQTLPPDSDLIPYQW